MTTAIRRRRGTTAQHSTFIGLEGETTIDTDKEVVVVHDGTTQGGYPQMRENGSNSALALGSAGTPSLKFTGDTNTGIYSPGADQVAISTNSVGRVFIDASGNVGLGATAPSNYKTYIKQAGAWGLVLEAVSNDSRLLIGDTNGEFRFSASYAGTGSYRPLTFFTSDLERLRITSAGLVGVGTSSPGAQFEIIKDSTFNNEGTFGLSITDGTSDVKLGCGVDATNNISFIQSLDPGTAYNTRPLTLNPNGGNVGIGTSSPIAPLQIVTTSAAYTTSMLAIGEQSNTTGKQLYLGMNTTDAKGYIQSAHWGTAYKELLLNPNGGNVGIGTTSPGSYNANLAVYSAGGAFVGALHANASGTFPKASAISLGSDAVSYTYTTGGASVALAGSAHIAALQSASPGAGTDIAFINTSGGSVSERARIDSSGRLLVGTSSARTNIFNASYSALFQVETETTSTSQALLTSATAGTQGARLTLAHHRSGSVGGNTILQSGDETGFISFQGSDGSEFVESAAIRAEVDGTPGANDMPGRLVFSTTADGASSPLERMRISQTGQVNISHGSIGSDVVVATHTSGSFTNAILSLGTTRAAGTACLFIYAAANGVNTFNVFNNGNVTNTNNSYAGISDIKLKENIVDASSQWDDIKALQVRKYNFKEKTGQQTHTQIGLVAQEVELVSPGLVSESPDRDAEGNDLGTTTKSVNYSVLYMKAVKALQEAMERIETLEAKVAALESA